jgi:DNA-binding NarL/FixJ family response regulator
MTRVLVVDDQPLVRAGIARILDAAPDLDIVAERDDGAEAVDAVRDHRPDVVLMDIRMPEVDGIAATRRLIGDGEVPVRILMLTTFDGDEYVYEAMKAGASGFMLKDAPRDDLVTAVRVVAAGDALLAPALTRRLIADFVRRPPPGAGPSGAMSDLTERELDVVRLVARGRSNAEIAAALVVSEATVKTHVARVLAKLGLRDRVQVVVAAYESGFVQPGEGGT